MEREETKRSDERELLNCYFAKVILTLLVVLGHSIHFWTGDWFAICEPVYTSKGLRYLSNFISGFHIYAFVLISGYIYYYMRIEQGKYKEFWKFVANKSKRLLIPYVFVTLFWLIPVQVVFYGWQVRDVFTKFVLAVSPSHLWFPWMLFWVFIILWPISKLLDNVGGYWV